MPDSSAPFTPEQWASLETLRSRDPQEFRREYLGDFRPTHGNIFGVEKLSADLAKIRAEIARAILIAHGRRSSLGRVPDLAALRRLEAEYVVRLDMAGGVPDE